MLELVLLVSGKKTKKDVADKIVEAKTSSFVQLKDRKKKKTWLK